MFDKKMSKHSIVWLATMLLCASGCSDEPDEKNTIKLDDALGLDIVLPTGDQPAGLRMAANDVVTSFARITGKEVGQGNIETSMDKADAPLVVQVLIESGGDDARPDRTTQSKQSQSASITAKDFGQGRKGLVIKATDFRGAMYGLYELTHRWGVQYLHPEQTFYPSNADLQLPEFEAQTNVAPGFTTRGFHEHTQHPIPASMIMLEGKQAYRAYASNYLKWMARNRQNASSLHMLKTLDFSKWGPYYSDVIKEGQSYGIRMGSVISFADQQQNNFRLIGEESSDNPDDAAQSIRDGLKKISDMGFDFYTFQMGTSEFTKPADSELLGWLDTAEKFLGMAYPNIEILTWIHPPCDLEAEDGSNFWHLPTRSADRVGLMVHTTMYYTVEHPAPVYGCENFNHQETLMKEVSGNRRQVFYPETAWWLGFDNNMPLALPATGWSRAFDIQQVLNKYDIEGHITFTTGREWMYWQYDHYLTKVTWDRTLTWEQYLDSIKGMYGAQGDKVAEVLKKWTDLQVKHFYMENPLIYFYLSGELTQDELGEKAGVLARRPKLAYDKVLQMSDEAFAQWKSNDLDMLKRMKDEYGALFDGVPETLTDGTAQQKALYREFFLTHDIYLKRIESSIALYSGVAALRPWFVEQNNARTEQRDPDMSIRDKSQAEAQMFLMQAKAITTDVQAKIKEGEGLYRLPLDMLAKPLPESLTSYPFGYLEETSRAYFWTRRDVQLERLMSRVLDPSNDKWNTLPDFLFITSGDKTTLKVPENRLAGRVLGSFIPQLLFGAVIKDATTRELVVAEDINENFLPDEGTETLVTGVLNGTVWTGKTDSLKLIVYDSAKVAVGELVVEDANFTINYADAGGMASSTMVDGELVGQYDSAILTTIVTETAGIDIDGASNLIKQVYGVAMEDPLPEKLPVHFVFKFDPVE